MNIRILAAAIVILGGCMDPARLPAPPPPPIAAAPASSADPPPGDPPPADPPPVADVPPPGPVDAGADVAEPDSSPATAEPAPPASHPSETVMAAGVIYILDYQASDVSGAARTKCETQAAGDPEKRTSCLQKERDAFTADALRFREKPPTWTIYRRDGDAFKEVYVARIAFADETATEVTVVPRDSSGARPLLQGRPKAVLGVPNTYQLILEDPRYGHLVYKARFESSAK